jgi:hypothetical protein
MYTNLPTSQSYIFRILQHFATKLCSFSNFDNFFPKISFVIPRLKIFLKRKSSISIIIRCSTIQMYNQWNFQNRAFVLIPQGPTQQKPWRPCWCSRQKSLIKILLNWNTDMAAVTSCANALLAIKVPKISGNQVPMLFPYLC